MNEIFFCKDNRSKCNITAQGEKIFQVFFI